VLANDVLQNGGQVQLLGFQQFLLFRARLALMRLLFHAVNYVRQMDRRGVAAKLTLHIDLPG
jgi:hypothetical protein